MHRVLSTARWNIGILCLMLPSMGVAASQLAPFFDGLKAARDIEQRKAYLRAEYRAPSTLIIHDELPVLLNALKDDDALVTFLAGEYFEELATMHLGEATVRDQLRPAAPALAAHFNDPDPRELLTESSSQACQWHRLVLTYFQYVLLPVPPDLISSVEAALYDPAWGFLAVRALGELKPMPAAVVNALIERMNDPHDAKLKGAIISVLGGQGDDPRVVEAIMEMLAGSDREQQRLAAGAAGVMGPAAKEALPYLRQILQANGLNQQTRHDVEWALDELEHMKSNLLPSIHEVDRSTRAAEPPSPKPMSIRAYFELLKGAKPEERDTLMKDFRATPSGQNMVPSDDVPFLIGVLNSGDPDLAERAAGQIFIMAFEFRGAGTNVRNVIAAALPAMEAHFDDPTSERPLDFGNRHRLRMLVMRFVGITGAVPSEHLLAEMLKAIDDENKDTAELAASVLAQIKPMTPQILDAVLGKINAPSSDMRRAVMQGLAANKNSDPRFIAGLAANLDDPVADHQAATNALAELGRAGRAAEPALRRLLSKQASENTPEGIAQMYA